MPDSLTLHLIGNAHLDPVWLWDWREGLNEGISTCQTMATLLEEFPDVRFIRGEAAIYQHIERHEPALFAKIRKLIAADRWEVVGGTYIQPDNNLPSTEAMIRQFVHGKRYFRETLGVDVTAAWSADCFGHSAGMPEIFAAAGMDAFAFTRPLKGIARISKPAFWWRGESGARILCYRPSFGWYGTEHDEMERRLDACLAEGRTSGLENIACFYGLGNHGGGPSRAHLRTLQSWAKRHPEVRVQHSGLHPLFAALRKELQRKGEGFLPELSGELNFCLRGCSSSVAKFKYTYRKAEARVFRAERTAAILSAAGRQVAAPLHKPWQTLLFNAFHDILPGTAIERAFDDQIAQLGGVLSEAQRVETDALLSLARQIDTRPRGWRSDGDQPEPVPVLVWNPHPWPLRTLVEAEVSLDYRPLWPFRHRGHEVRVAVTDGNGRLVPAQRIAEEHDSMIDLPWRARMVIPAELPAFGWSVFHIGLRRPARARASTVSGKGPTITNGLLTVEAPIGAERIAFTFNGKPWLGNGMAVRVYEDPWGAWGGMQEEVDSWQLKHERERWRVDAQQVLENGPERAALWVRFAGTRSKLELTFQLARGVHHVRVHARVLWVDRSARLKLAFPIDGPAEYEVPGGRVSRDEPGEVPGGRWVRVGQGAASLGFASDALYGFDSTEDEWRATIVRASRYASDVKRSPEDSPWLPAVDAGELRFSFLLTPDTDALPRLSAELEEPPVVMTVPSRAGVLPASQSLAGGLGSGFRLLALRSLETGSVELRLQNSGHRSKVAKLDWLGQRLNLGTVRAQEIATWHLFVRGKSWRAERAGAATGAAVLAGMSQATTGRERRTARQRLAISS